MKHFKHGPIWIILYPVNGEQNSGAVHLFTFPMQVFADYFWPWIVMIIMLRISSARISNTIIIGRIFELKPSEGHNGL